VVCHTFSSISVFDPAEGALRDPRYFPLTNNLRLVKKNFSSSKLSALMKKHENPKISQFAPYISHLIRFSDILHGLWVSVFLIQHKVLCGIQDIFL